MNKARVMRCGVAWYVERGACVFGLCVTSMYESMYESMYVSTQVLTFIVSHSRQVHSNFLMKGNNDTSSDAWIGMKKRARQMLHKLVDELVDNTPYMERMQRVYVSQSIVSQLQFQLQ